MRIVPAGILAAVIVVSATACGSSGSPRPGGSGTSGQSGTPAPLAGLIPSQIVQRAVNNLEAITSVRITGKLVSRGEDLAIDYTVGAEGCQGTVTETPSASSTGVASGTVAVIEADGTVYVKFGESYLEGLHPTASVFAELNGKYITATSNSKLAVFAAWCDVPKLVRLVDQAGTAGFVKAGTATIDGQPALAFKQLHTAPEDIVYISDYAIPEILSMRELANQEFFLDFTKYDAPFSVTAPPAHDVVDGSKFDA
jgi:hypothetical protein